MNRGSGRLLAAALVIAAAGFAGGCGKKGSPLPPLRVRPQAAEGLSVHQRGAVVVVSLEAPKGRTDGSPFDGDAVLRLTLQAEDSKAAAKGAGRRARAAAPDGAGSVSWIIPRDEWPSYRVDRRLEIPIPIADLELRSRTAASSHAGRKISFFAEIREGKRSRSAIAGPVTLGLCDAPAPPRALRGVVTADGVRLSWESSPDAAVTEVRVYRAAPDKPFPVEPYRVLPKGTADYLDAGAPPGTAWKYHVRFGGGEESSRCESDPSPESAVTVIDTFAPAAPEGLAAAAEESVIRLFWTPGAEADIAGYHVWRAEKSGGEFVRLTSDPVAATTYADATAERGKRYLYAVSAVDGATPPNESGRSAPVEEGLP